MYFQISGMSCVNCVKAVEKAVSSLEGVETVSVSLLTNSMEVEGTATASAIEKAVKKAGYKAAYRKEAKSDDTEEYRTLRREFWISFALHLPLLFLTLAPFFKIPYPPFLSDYITRGAVECGLCLIVLVVDRRFFIHGFGGIFRGNTNMDTLVALGSSVAFLYSVLCLLLFPEGEPELFFSASTMIPLIVTLGKTLEAYSKTKTGDALRDLKKLLPETAMVYRDQKTVAVPTESLLPGDFVLIKAGENIPADGIIREGSASIQEAMLTGESLPKDKTVGDAVNSGTTCLTGWLKVEVQVPTGETLLAKMIDTVLQSSRTKAPAERLADRISSVFIPIVIGLATLTFVIWILAAGDLSRAINYGISVLVVSCPCALGLATPVAIFVGNGRAAKNQILFKTAEALEYAGIVKTVLFDKTGTLTTGEMSVTDVCSDRPEQCLQVAGALESLSGHPIAASLTKYVREKSISLPEDVKDFRTSTGFGVEGILCQTRYRIGRESYLWFVPPAYREKANALTKEGKTVLYIGSETDFLGLIGIRDTVKEDAKESIRKLKAMHIHTVLLSGDQTETAEAIGKELGIDEIYGSMLPLEKAEAVRRYKNQSGKKEKVLMVGDGINDAPALSLAPVGAAVGGGTDIAVRAGNVVLLKGDPEHVVKAIRIGRITRKIIRENLFWAFFYNLLMIPLAAGAYAALLGVSLNPVISSLAMSISSITVVLNALRIRSKKL